FLLISDGEDYGVELNDALVTFREEHRRVHCIGIGSDKEVPVPLRMTGDHEELLRDDRGRPVTTRFEQATLVQIAGTTGGRYVRSTTGGELARTIADLVNGERKVVGWRTSTAYHELYRLGLATAAGAGAMLWLML